MAYTSGLRAEVSVHLEVHKDILGGTRKHNKQNETQDPLKPLISSDAGNHEDSSLNLGAGMPEKNSVISLTSRNHINN
jgi:hypothetical protein